MHTDFRERRAGFRVQMDMCEEEDEGKLRLEPHARSDYQATKKSGMIHIPITTINFLGNHATTGSWGNHDRQEVLQA